MRAFINLFLILLVVTGCSRGPDSAALEQQIQNNLDTTFRAGLFKIDSLRRTGSSPTSAAGEKRLLVYYNARIEFADDYDLNSWDKLNAGTLANSLGATEQGVSGIVPGGNSKGDILMVHGRATFRDTDGSWQLVTGSAGAELGAVPDLENTAPQSGAKLLLAEIAEAANTARTNVRGLEAVIVERELTVALRNIHMQLDGKRGATALGSGETAGEYFRVGRALEANLSSAQFPFRNHRTDGSVENAQLLQSNALALALMQNDIAAMAYTGTGFFADRAPMENLRALATLYPEPIHVVTLAGSDIRSIADLRGKKVDLGLPGSGSRVNAELVLDAHGIALSELGHISSRGIAASVALIESGDIDAFVVTVAAPARHLQNLAARQPIRVLSLDDNALHALARANPALVPTNVPAGTYPGQQAEVHTLSVTAMLVAHKDLSDERVTHILTSLFDNVESIAREGFPASAINPATARTGVTIPLHPAAETYYKGR